MIVLDTNVLSEIMRPAPEPRVLEWGDSVPPRHMAITAVTVAEILYGIGRMTEGKKGGASFGRLMSMADAQIAAVCRVHQCTLATRNERDCEGTGAKTVNPWSHAFSEDEERSKGYTTKP